MIRIAVTGPESSGKSSLCRELAEHYRTKWVPEFSRMYLTAKKGKYIQQDLTKILKGQLAMEQRMEGKANKLLFCDTEPINFLIWSDVKFGKIDSALIDLAYSVRYNYYILCYPDLEWEPDSLREEPTEQGRIELFNQFRNYLDADNKQYIIIRGTLRKNVAISAIDNFMLQQ